MSTSLILESVIKSTLRDIEDLEKQIEWKKDFIKSFDRIRGVVSE